MSEKLKPCPFCGGEAVMIGQDGIAWCQCPQCNCEGPTEEYEFEARRAWNQRFQAAGAQS